MLVSPSDRIYMVEHQLSGSLYKHLSGAAHLTIEVCLNMEYLDPMEGHLGYVGYLSQPLAPIRHFVGG